MHSNGQHIDYDLLMLYLTKEAGAQQIKEVEEWLRASNENKIVLDELEKLWIETGKISPPPVAVDIDSAWNNIFAKIQPGESKNIVLHPEIEKNKGHNFKVLIRVAAILLILLGGYGVFKLINKDVEPVILVSDGTPVTNVLPDNSKIKLNGGSKILYPKRFKGKTREISLEGEAYFKVTKDKERPFIVHTEIADITVLGTAFNVKAIPNTNVVEVLVETGKVRLVDNSKTKRGSAGIVLEAGTSGIINRNTGTIEKLDSIDTNKLFWKTNKLIFQNCRLSDIFSLLEEQFHVSIQTTTPEIGNCFLTVTFENNNIDYILEVIATTQELTFRKENNIYLFEGNGCE